MRHMRFRRDYDKKVIAILGGRIIGVWHDWMFDIRVTAGDSVLEGILYGNPTAREFAKMLPLTVELWHPAPDFARAFDLQEQIAQKGTLVVLEISD